MWYTLLDRPNPSRHPIYFPGYLSSAEERKVISDVQRKKVKYVVTDWQSNFGKKNPISAWLLNKKKLYSDDQYAIIQLY